MTPKTTRPVLLFDLWRTLAWSATPEPVWDLQRILGHRDGRPDDAFLRRCLTLDVDDPAAFLGRLAQEFDRPVTRAVLAAFEEVLDAEARSTRVFDDVEPVLDALREQGYRLGVVSNAWPFSVPHVFGAHDLARHFEHRVFSYETGSRKPEPAMFLEASRRFGVTADACLMVGDNVDADVRGSVRLGMRAALIDRTARDDDPGLATIPGAFRLRTLRELPRRLGTSVGEAACAARSGAGG